MTRDMRDPKALGERILTLTESLGVPATKVMDEVICESGVDFVDEPTPLEKYGDPRERGEAWVEAHA